MVLPILHYIAQLEKPGPTDQNDFAIRLHTSIEVLYTCMHLCTGVRSKVEFCAGAGELTAALVDAFDFKGKRFDLNYSKNHDFLRTVGFLAVLAAVSRLC